ncbi:MAG: indolepyruvate oxidoreductase subunit beta [Clostridia bacterium]|nr:indolepyruvate oxidoreductase subunit beta [Clostridia bacterium]
MSTTSIMIVGVGGQGTLLTSRILGRVAQDSGYDVKVSEVHGMSQRGGSVVTYVKYGESVFSPIIDKGCADIILAFEELEAYRYLEYLKPGGKMICNTQNINPMPVILGMGTYPQNISDKIKEKGIDFFGLNALRLAQEAGNAKAANVALIGVLAKNTAIPKSEWLDAINATVPSKLLDVNIRAFEAGYGI